MVRHRPDGVSVVPGEDRPSGWPFQRPRRWGGWGGPTRRRRAGPAGMADGQVQDHLGMRADRTVRILTAAARDVGMPVLAPGLRT